MKFNIRNLDTEESDIQVIIEKINEVIDKVNKTTDSIEEIERHKFR